ncbi:DUF1080 domain-containing protein [Candidatus Sumerlaeota bacterium]|nr:DUF1080 domain-containing protein [Candidatus Sumerlaeota bacterium]
MSVFKPRGILFGSAIAAIVLVSAGPLSLRAEEPGFVDLFNGSDLSGWTGDPKLWNVEDGVIVGSTHGVEIKANSFLATEKSFSDFILKVSVKLENHNSGIQFRSESLGDYAAAGYQVDIADAYYGMLYEERKRGFMDYWKKMSGEEQQDVLSKAKKGDWNDFEITCRGDHILIALNGKTVCDITDPDGAKEGIIALQLHTGPEMRVRFKDIRIKELE